MYVPGSERGRKKRVMAYGWMGQRRWPGVVVVEIWGKEAGGVYAEGEMSARGWEDWLGILD